MLVVGEKEKETEQVAVRTRKGDDLGSVTLDEFIAQFDEVVSNYN
jgi:threonyl-tRNA synthetase